MSERLQQIIAELPTLTVDSFTFERYCPDNAWVGEGVPPADWTPLGKIDSCRLTVRPRCNGIAVLFEDSDGDLFWQHMPDNCKGRRQNEWATQNKTHQT